MSQSLTRLDVNSRKKLGKILYDVFSSDFAF